MNAEGKLCKVYWSMRKSPGNEAKMNWNWDHSWLGMRLGWNKALHFSKFLQIWIARARTVTSNQIEELWNSAPWLAHMVDAFNTGSCNLEKCSRMVWEWACEQTSVLTWGQRKAAWGHGWMPLICSPCCVQTAAYWRWRSGWWWSVLEHDQTWYESHHSQDPES